MGCIPRQAKKMSTFFTISLSGRTTFAVFAFLAFSFGLRSQTTLPSESIRQNSSGRSGAETLPNGNSDSSSNDEANTSPRERGRILQKRNPIASEYQSFGELGSGPGADVDGEGVDYRSFFPNDELFSGSREELKVDTNINLNKLSAKSKFGGGLSIRRALDEDSKWVLAAQLKSSASDRSIEHYEAVWRNLSTLRKDDSYNLSPSEEADLYYLDRPRYSVDEIETRNNLYAAQIGFQPDERNTLFYKVSYQDYSDHFYRNRLEIQYGSGTLDDFSNSAVINETILEKASLSGVRTRRYFGSTNNERQRQHHILGGNYKGDHWEVDYSIYSQKWNVESEWFNWNFNDFDLAINYDASNPNLASYQVAGKPDLLSQEEARFSSLRIHDSFTNDEDLAWRVDGERKARFLNRDLWIQLGALHREKERENGEQRDVFSVDPANPFFLSDVERPSAPDTIIEDAIAHQSGLDPDTGAMLLETDPDKFVPNPFSSKVESAPNFYNAFESVSSAYVLGFTKFGDLSLEAGLRFEETTTETTGRIVVPEIVDDPNEGVLLESILDPSGQVILIKDLSAQNSYNNTLPSLEASYRLSEKTEVKGSWFQTIMRPQYFSIVNYRRISVPTQSISEGNPELDPTAIEKYRLALIQDFDSFGKLSVEVYKIDVEDFFYGAVSQEDILEDGKLVEYTIGRTENGDTASINGYELQWQQQMERALLWENAKITLAYTYSDSEATLPTRPNEIILLPERSKHLLKTSFSGNIGPISTSINLNYQSSALDDIGDISAEDEYREKVISLSLSSTYKISEKSQVYLNLYNLTNHPERSFESTPLKRLRNQYSDSFAILGFRQSF